MVYIAISLDVSDFIQRCTVQARSQGGGSGGSPFYEPPFSENTPPPLYEPPPHIFPIDISYYNWQIQRDYTRTV